MNGSIGNFTEPFGKCKRLRFEINGEFGIWDFFDEIEQHFMSLFIHDDRDQSILQGVAAENICKGCADNCAESEGVSAQGACSRLEPHPSCHLPTEFVRPAFGFVQDEIRFG